MTRTQHLLSVERSTKLYLFHDPVKITLKQPVLHDAIFFELALGVGFGNFSSYLSRILQYFPVSGLNESIQTGFPVLHSHWDFALRHVLGYMQIGRARN